MRAVVATRGVVGAAVDVMAVSVVVWGAMVAASMVVVDLLAGPVACSVMMVATTDSRVRRSMCTAVLVQTCHKIPE